jgi:hypothetical protein
MRQPSIADLAEQPVVRSSIFPAAGQGFSGSPSFGILVAYPPTACGPAAFRLGIVRRIGPNDADVDFETQPTARLSGQIER